MSFTLLGILNAQAAGGGGEAAFDLLETTTLTSANSSVTFSGLAGYSDYKHLQIRMTTSNTNTGSGTRDITLRFNGDSGSNYAYHTVSANTSNVFAQGEVNFSQINLINGTIEGGYAAGMRAPVIIDILDFSSTNKNTTVKVLTGMRTSFTYMTFQGGAWFNTSAVSSILLQSQVNSFATGSRFSLYGIKG